jgi:L-amino acid N-acyltransferase YncA
MLHYRNATEKDLPVIVAIYNSIVAGRMVTADTEPVTVESRIQWFNEHLPDKHPLWIVEDATKEIVGWVSFQKFYGRPAYDATAEISIYLDEKQRGKGYGKTILQYCINSAPQYHFKTLLGFIFSHNQPSMKLFMQLGFEEWGHFPNVAVLDGVERSLSILGKRVG